VGVDVREVAEVRNLERNLRATLQIEAGEEYHLLRGVMLRCDVILHRDVEGRHRPGSWRSSPLRRRSAGEPSAEARELVRRQAPKRVGLQFVERSRATWDHRKLGGAY